MHLQQFSKMLNALAAGAFLLLHFTQNVSASPIADGSSSEITQGGKEIPFPKYELKNPDGSGNLFHCQSDPGAALKRSEFEAVVAAYQDLIGKDKNTVDHMEKAQPGSCIPVVQVGEGRISACRLGSYQQNRDEAWKPEKIVAQLYALTGPDCGGPKEYNGGTVPGGPGGAYFVMVDRVGAPA
ncbi:MAG: hypothetical protein M1831_004465 [Alyxoria varia]|nr:MAG: hypothetical protein M1831_004465 [Alyxoria varia]